VSPLRNPKRSFASLFTTAAMAAGLLAIVPAQPAAAAIPDTNWPPATISDIGQQYSFPQLDGGVTVGGCGTAPRVSRSFSTTGAITQSFSQNIGGMVRAMCPWSSAVGADGTVYMIESTPTGGSTRLLAFKAGQLKWSYPVPCDAQVSSVQIGIEGNVYFVTTPCNGQPHLMGVTPIAPSGTTAPTRVLDVSLVGLGNVSGLAVYARGFAIRGGDSSQTIIQYVSRTGIIGSRQVLPPSAMYGEKFDTTMQGRGFVATKASPNISCIWGDAESHIRSVNPNGVGWTAELAPCTYVREMKPTPSGGVVVHWYVQAPDGSIVDELAAFGYDGTFLWHQPYPVLDQALPYAGTAFAVDLNGNVAIQRSVMVGKTINGTYYKFPQVHFSLRNGGTGVEYFEQRTRLNGLTSTTAGPSYKSIDQQVRIAKNTAYVTALKCTTWPDCPASSAKVYSFPIAGLEIDYPRGVILKSSLLAWKNYVAMGDSYSSGEGVEPFDPATDTAGPPENRCHRSDKAYANLLDGNPSLRYNLTAFVACSGATTQSVAANQLSSLSGSTDVVTLTVGGNNIGFEAYARSCWEGHADCTEDSYDAAIDDIENQLPGELDDLFEAIDGEIGAQTEVLILSYPLLVPEANASTTWPNCLYLTADERTAARDVITQLNGALEDAVGRAGSQFKYVDTNYANSPLKGHEICNDGNYFHGAVGPFHTEYSFHPNELGQGGLATIVETYS